jgi:hypothetical protein
VSLKTCVRDDWISSVDSKWRPFNVDLNFETKCIREVRDQVNKKAAATP